MSKNLIPYPEPDISYENYYRDNSVLFQFAEDINLDYSDTEVLIEDMENGRYEEAAEWVLYEARIYDKKHRGTKWFPYLMKHFFIGHGNCMGEYIKIAYEHPIIYKRVIENVLKQYCKKAQSFKNELLMLCNKKELLNHISTIWPKDNASERDINDTWYLSECFDDFGDTNKMISEEAEYLFLVVIEEMLNTRNIKTEY